MRWKPAILGFTKWVIAIAYLVVALAFANSKSRQVVCSSVNIIIADSLANSFIAKSDIAQKIEQHQPNLIGIPLQTVNTLDIENQLTEMQEVRSVNAYKTIDGALTVNIQQRQPMVRIINRYGESYYIDKEGQILPLSDRYTSHVLVINGNIIEPFDIEPNVQIASWLNKEVTNNTPLIVKLYEFARYITNDEFWNAQITQVYVDNPSNIELIPRVGPHSVQLGNLSDYETKLAKLKLFYERALPEEGWNKYSEINLKYKNQIVCTKR
ncbi:MAG: cell division protein FtsQ/DivIB [Bacteroidales bacterium]